MVAKVNISTDVFLIERCLLLVHKRIRIYFSRLEGHTVLPGGICNTYMKMKTAIPLVSNTIMMSSCSLVSYGQNKSKAMHFGRSVALLISARFQFSFAL